MIPVHPEDCHLLGMEWNGKWYVDTALPFGLWSAPKIFTAVADVIVWIMFTHGIRGIMHYLDDYLFFGEPDSHECARTLQQAKISL